MRRQPVADDAGARRHRCRYTRNGPGGARQHAAVSRSAFERLMGEALDYLAADGSERTIDTHIKNLRAKLGNSAWIETVRGFGYRFAGEKK